MFGLGWKVSIFLAIAGAGTWLWMDSQLSKAREEVAVLKQANLILEENEAKLQKATDEQKQAMDMLIKGFEDTKERIVELTQKTESIHDEAKKYRIEIDGLRQTEAAAAIENPYNRGIAADTRMRKLMQSISGATTTPPES